jgi:hypothetical protein
LRNFKPRSLFLLGAMCLLMSAAWGDSLELKNGSLIKGKYLGGTEDEISFQVGSTVQRYAVDDIASINFDSSSRAAPAPPEASQPAPRVAQPPVPRPPQPELASRPPQPEPVTATTPSTQQPPSTVTVPSGTRIMVRTIDAVDSDRNQVGDKFQASLEQPLVVDDVTVVPKGADVYGRLTQAAEAGRVQGRSQLKLELTGIVVNGQTIPLVTGDYSVSGSSRGATTAKRVGGGAAVGAVIGAIAGGGKGAAIGAGVGAGAGTAVQVMTKGEQVHVPSETLLEFSLQQDVKMPVANITRTPAVP